jgi:hypothetical protein
MNFLANLKIWTDENVLSANQTLLRPVQHLAQTSQMELQDFRQYICLMKTKTTQMLSGHYLFNWIKTQMV